MGRSIIKAVSMGLLAIFAGMQCIRPEKNEGVAGQAQSDLFARHNAPPDIRKLMENACYDCHSNRTRYPWYAEVQPGGWLLAKHVRDGKRLVNFSEFGELSPTRAKRQLEACIDEIEEGEMPLESYTWIHHEARLTEDQVRAIVAWMEIVVEDLEKTHAAASGRLGNVRFSAD